MPDTTHEVPILADMMRWFIDDDIHSFFAELEAISEALNAASSPVRQKMLDDGEILVAEYTSTVQQLAAIDSASVPVAIGEVLTVASLAVHYSPYHQPKFIGNRKTGYNNELYKRLASALRLHGEITLMAETDHYTIADNSWWSYLMEMNQLITLYENFQVNERSALETIYNELVKDNGAFVRAIHSPFIVAMSKTGSSRATYKRHGYQQFFKAPISDLALFSNILKPGEYTKPRYLKDATDGSFGVEERGWSKADVSTIRNRFEGRDGLHVTFFKPHPFKKAFRIEFGYEATGDLPDLLTMVRNETVHRTIIEPVPQLYADRLAKQVSAISKMYGQVNSAKFYDILFPTRT